MPTTPLPEPAVPQTQSEHDQEDHRLDEELDETFPASDPVPYRHDSTPAR